MITKCSYYGDGCKERKCKRVYEDDAKYIQELVDYDDSIISAGQRIFGRAVSLDDDHIGRIRKATQRRIDFIRSGMPRCKDFEFTEGRYKNMPLYPRRVA